MPPLYPQWVIPYFSLPDIPMTFSYMEMDVQLLLHS